jgi:hypothetical protein
MAVRVRRSLGASVCLTVAAAGVLVLSSPLAHGSSPTHASTAADFHPYSVTFVSLDTGWALGTAPCASAGACLELFETTNGGHSWSQRPLPAGLLAAADRRVGGVPADLAESAAGGLNVRFADPQDGWIYGGIAVVPKPSAASGTEIEAVLWSTHDGGLQWQQQTLSGLGEQDLIFDLEAAHGTAHLMQSNTTNGVTIKSSPVSSDSWHVTNTARLGSPAGGGEQQGSFVLQGSSGWLVEGNDRGTTGSARLEGGRWVSWTPPCASVGHSFAVPAAATPEQLVASCVMGGFAYPLPKDAPPGAKLESNWLYFSDNGGNSFKHGPELPAGFEGVLASPVPGVIFGSIDGEELVASFDGGVHWAVAYPRELSFLGFTSPTQGVGIVRVFDAATSTMIMTYDGGHHWSPVSF